MKLKKEMVFSEIENDYYAVPIAEASKAFNGMIRCNKTTIFLLNELKHDKSENELVEALVKKYEVEEKRARQDIRRIIVLLSKAGLIDD